jgi:hypothetical protein
VREIQDKVAQVFLANAPEIVEDVHQFLEARNREVIFKARLNCAQAQMGDSILEASKGMLVNVVEKDAMDWCTVFTSNKRVGLVHDRFLTKISAEEASEMEGGPNADELMDIIREKAPEMLLLFEAMGDEAVKLREALEKVA